MNRKLLTLIFSVSLFNCEEKKEVITEPPWVTISELIQTSATYALFRVNVTSEQGLDEYGVCWNTDPNPRIEDDSKEKGDDLPAGSSEENTNIGNTLTLNCLIPGTTYYAKGYAKNKWGISYGAEIQFTTELEEYTGGLGDPWHDGIVFFKNDTPTKSGLICTFPLPPIEWGCAGTLIGTTSSIGSGATNTTKLYNGCAMPNAARTCIDVDVNKDIVENNCFNDWYLPSKDELNLIYEGLILTSFIETGGYKQTHNGIYLSSTEFDENYVWVQNFNDGAQTTVLKSTKISVLAITSY